MTGGLNWKYILGRCWWMIIRKQDILEGSVHKSVSVVKSKERLV